MDNASLNAMHQDRHEADPYRRIELITSMKEPSRARDLGWVGDIDIAPDGSPIFTRNIGTQEIYALNLRWPK